MGRGLCLFESTEKSGESWRARVLVGFKGNRVISVVSFCYAVPFYFYSRKKKVGNFGMEVLYPPKNYVRSDGGEGAILPFIIMDRSVGIMVFFFRPD